MILIEELQVEVRKGRPFQGGGLSDINMTDIDPSMPVYPIRGSYEQYSCKNIDPKDPNGWPDKPGKNCLCSHIPKATGACWKTSFGDWKCSLVDSSNAGTWVVKTSPAPRSKERGATIAGVVGTAKQYALNDEGKIVVYFPDQQNASNDVLGGSHVVGRLCRDTQRQSPLDSSFRS
jgi:hypothetical protein